MKLTIELGECTLARLEKMMADLTTALNDLSTAVSASTAEMAALVTELQAAIAAGDPNRIQAAADAIEAQVKVLNDATAAAKADNPTVPPTPAAASTP